MPPGKSDCSGLAEDAIKAALADFRERYGRRRRRDRVALPAYPGARWLQDSYSEPPAASAPEEEFTMAYVIAEPCINVKDKACVEVCPVDCIYEGPDQLFIHPDECIDCGACEPVCPVTAIFAEDETPEQWKHFIELNRQFFLDHPGVQACTTRN